MVVASIIKRLAIDLGNGLEEDPVDEAVDCEDLFKEVELPFPCSDLVDVILLLIVTVPPVRRPPPGCLLAPPTPKMSPYSSCAPAESR